MPKKFLIPSLIFLIGSVSAEDSPSVKGVFRNMTAKPVMVYWVDEDGSNQIYHKDPVPAYGQQEFLSYPGTTWRAYHNQNLLTDYVATEKKGQVFLITLAPLTTPPGPKKPGIGEPARWNGAERFYSGSWKRSDCVAKLVWEKATGDSTITGVIINSQYISVVSGNFNAASQKLALTFKDDTEPAPHFTLLKGYLDGQLTWHDDEGLDLLEVAAGDVDVESFENIAGVMIGADEDSAAAAAKVAHLGRPVKGIESLSDATGEFFQTWDFPGSGISLLMSSEEAKGWKSVATITMKSPSRHKTLQGIGIGTTEREAKLAYASFFVEKSELQALGKDQHLVGSIYGGLLLTFRNGLVSEIFLGPAAE